VTNKDTQTATHQDQLGPRGLKPEPPQTGMTDRNRLTVMRPHSQPAPCGLGQTPPQTQVTDEDQPTTRIHHIQTGQQGPGLEPRRRQTKDEDRTDDPGEMANKASQRLTDPANPGHIQTILEKISIRMDLTDKEWTAVTDLIKEYQDIFALSLSEVFPVNFVTHKLKLDPDTVLPKKAHQQPITELQRKFFADIIDDMEKVGVIWAVPAEFIKCLNATNLAPKEAGKNLGMS